MKSSQPERKKIPPTWNIGDIISYTSPTMVDYLLIVEADIDIKNPLNTEYGVMPLKSLRLNESAWERDPSLQGYEKITASGLDEYKFEA